MSITEPGLVIVVGEDGRRKIRCQSNEVRMGLHCWLYLSRSTDNMFEPVETMNCCLCTIFPFMLSSLCYTLVLLKSCHCLLKGLLCELFKRPI